MFTKPVLFIDIDGTVADSIPWWMTLYNHDHLTTFEKSQLTTYDPRDSIKIDLSNYYEDYRGVSPVANAMVSIVRLRVYYEVVFVTAGFGSDWLRSRGISNPIIQVKNRKYLRGYALIDDCPKNLDDFDGLGFLVKQPWNPYGMTWEQITEALIHAQKCDVTDGVCVAFV